MWNLKVTSGIWLGFHESTSIVIKKKTLAGEGERESFIYFKQNFYNFQVWPLLNNKT